MIIRIITTFTFLILIFTECKKDSSPYEPGDSYTGSWELVYQSAGDTYFRDMHFTDQYKGWMVGDSGTVLHSDDQGGTWHYQQTGTENDLRAVYFVDEYKGWIVGDYSTLLKTTNGGQDWVQLAFPDTLRFILNSVYFIDDLNGYIAGYLFNDNDNYLIESGGGIWHTTDSGQSWAAQEIKTPWVIFSIQFFDYDEGWAITTNDALHTTDGGKVWEIVPIPTQPDTFVVIMDNMFFLNNEKGWVSGLNASDSPFTGLPIYYTSDGGSLWEAQAHFSTHIIESIFFIDEYRGWAGSNGAIYYSLNGGNTWNIHYEDGGERFLDICFVNADLGWALSMRGNIYQYSCQ